MVNVRMTADTFRAIRSRALAEGVTDATVARQILAKATTGEVADVQPVPRPAPPFAPPPSIVADLRAVREAAAEATGALVQLAAMARREGLAGHHADLEHIIPHMRQAAFEFLELADEVTRAWREYRVPEQVPP
jgi:hypothetical protein